MKIALVIEHFDATRGGAEHIAVFIAGELARRGHEVHVLCRDARRRLQHMREAHQGASHDARRSQYAGGRAQADPPDGVQIHTLRGLKLSTRLGFAQFGRQARAWCKKHKPDLVHSLTVAFAGDIYHPEAGVYARMQQQAVASRTSKSSGLFKRWLQKLNGKQRLLLSLESHATKPWTSNHKGGAWKIISISGGMNKEFAAHYQLPASRCFRLDNPRTSPLPAPKQAAEDRAWFRGHYNFKETDRIAIFVGHDFRRKGLRWAIEAVAKTTDWSLIVVGLGKIREYLLLAQSRNLEHRVKFIGPTREVERLYCASDALLLPVFYDPAPFVVIEALACGLPVISTSHLGSADIIESNHVGTIVPEPRDSDLLAQALQNLPREGEPLRNLRSRAQKAAAGLAPDAFMNHLLALYQDFLAANRPAPPQ